MRLSSLRPYLLLTRISLAPSAAIDALVGVALGNAGNYPGARTLVSACAASLCIFCGGMALNDWADRERDHSVRPDRVLPSGRLSAGRALGFALGLLALGVALGFSLGLTAGLCLTAVALMACAYDLWLRGAWLGPLALGFCRTGNLGFGIVVGLNVRGAPIELASLLPAIAYGTYVVALSRLSAFEDGARPIEGNQPAVPLRTAAILLGALPASAFALRPEPQGWGSLAAFTISIAAAFGLWRAAHSQGEWTRQRVGQAMGLCLRRLMFATASLACMAWQGTWFAEFATLCGLLGMRVSHQLRKSFPPS